MATQYELYRTYIDGAFRAGVVFKRGRKWLHFWYVGAPRPRKLHLAEERYLRPLGKMTQKQRKRFNESVRTFGGPRVALRP